MTIRPITIHGEPVLHRRAAEVTEIDAEVRTLVEDMFQTQDAARGVGLAAPQVGVGLRIFTWTFEDSGGAPPRGHIINPVLTRIGRTSQEDPDPDEESEGCLSVPGYSFPLKRSDLVRLTGQDVDGNAIDLEAAGWFARVLQHEYDHLDGYLYVNRLNGKWTRRWKKALRREGWTGPGNTWLPGTDRDPFGHDDADVEAGIDVDEDAAIDEDAQQAQ